MNSTETAIVRGVKFLSGNQKSGAWEGFFGYGQAGDEWPTALTSRFLQAGQNLEDQLSCELHQACQMLIRHRRPLGWGFGQQSPPDCDSTANALLCLRNGSNLEILEQWRDPTGLWITYSTGDAFASQFDDFSKPMPCVSATVAELLSQHQREAGCALLNQICCLVEPVGRSLWWESDIYTTFCLVSAARVLQHWPVGLRQRLAMELRQTQRSGGGWGHQYLLGCCPFLTSLAAWCCQQLGLEDLQHRALSWLLACQKQDGSWSSFPVMYFPPLSGQSTGIEHLGADLVGNVTTAAALMALSTCVGDLPVCRDYGRRDGSLPPFTVSRPRSDGFVYLTVANRRYLTTLDVVLALRYPGRTKPSIHARDAWSTLSALI